MNISVIGAGAMGTAIAIVLEQAQHRVDLLATRYDKQFVEAIEETRIHPALNRWVPESIAIHTHDAWEEPLARSEIVAIGVASVGVRDVVEASKRWLRPDAIWGIGSKGWDPDTARPLSQVVSEASPDHPVVVMVGPSLASELAEGIPTGMVCASDDLAAAHKVAEALSAGPSVRAFVTDDVAGVEVGAALKNVLAIAIGMCDGIADAKGRAMTNTKAAVFSRGLVEMSRLAKALGGRHETVLGLAGAGDLFVTVLGGRNGRFGRLVGTGLPPKKALTEMATTVEGYENTREAMILADDHGLDMPVVRMVNSVLFDGVSPDDAVASLLLGDVEPEI